MIAPLSTRLAGIGRFLMMGVRLMHRRLLLGPSFCLDVAIGAVVEVLADWQKSRSSAALILFDLDHFKPINDEGGHALGVEHAGKQYRVSLSLGVTALRDSDRAIDAPLKMTSKKRGLPQHCLRALTLRQVGALIAPI